MEDAFLSLEKDKQERILNAAFKEFSEKGYKNASTNQIAKEAGIGKGTLFYYFGNKKNLFHQLIDEAFDIAYREYLSKVNFEETDFFKRIEEMSLLKWNVYQKYEQALNFMGHILMHSENYALPDDLKSKQEQAEKIWGSLLTENIDFTKFREDIPKETSFNFIRWTIEGYRAELEQRLKQEPIIDYTNEHLKPYYDEFYDHLGYLKKIYYKDDSDG
ncbi:TetR/AcrR family transcriptional regulator [Alkalibacterium sp. f15]|uniref:TetR/AcrR family transcriptional regulator n=1 Tax=Alkalibacterium sp. f15 TaxID=3414029 RepID=UPI003BF80A31